MIMYTAFFVSGHGRAKLQHQGVGVFKKLLHIHVFQVLGELDVMFLGGRNFGPQPAEKVPRFVASKKNVSKTRPFVSKISAPRSWSFQETLAHSCVSGPGRAGCDVSGREKFWPSTSTKSAQI